MTVTDSKVLLCGHYPHVTRIVFAIGTGKEATYKLCENCKSHPVYQNHIVSIENISQLQEIKN